MERIWKKKEYAALMVEVLIFDFKIDVLSMSDESKDNEFEGNFGSNS